jgi:hypothetical protein
MKDEKKLTAVEWLEDRYRPKSYITAEEFAQAKEMEEQEREDMYKKGWFDAIETYGGNKCQFEIHNSTSSATICKWCGKEKWQHKTYEDNQ